MPLLTSPDELANKTFDYVVVGAGGSGATLASRLTEDPNVNVLLLEAGGILYDDPMVDIPAQFGATFLNPKYDWGFPVVKQACSNNVEHVWPRGRGLGGSTTMNFLCWIKPPAKDVDAFEKLGNPGWNWADFQKYSLRAETFVPAGKEITDAYPHTYNEKFRGTSGPVVVTDPIHAHTADKIFIDTLVNKGVKVLEDPYGGDVNGAYLASNNVDPRTWKRTHSASAYLRPFEDRQNLNVLPNAFVTRVLWADEKDAEGNLVATGVEYTFGEQTLTAAATKEVILSAGAIKSPHILELSGVGKPDVLQKIGVDIKLNLPGVGENVQEHHFANIVFQLDETKAEHKTLDLLFNPEFAKESIRLHAEGKGTHRTGITAFAFLPLTSRAPEETSAAINELERDIKARIAKGEIPPALAKQYELQLEALKDNTHPDMELIAFPGYFMARGQRLMLDISWAVLTPALDSGSHSRETLPKHSHHAEPPHLSWKHPRQEQQPQGPSRNHCKLLQGRLRHQSPHRACQVRSVFDGDGAVQVELQGSATGACLHDRRADCGLHQGYSHHHLPHHRQLLHASARRWRRGRPKAQGLRNEEPPCRRPFYRPSAGCCSYTE